ncbi:MAG: sugar phosphate nucleotidyltransferase [SAR324 cluster bacterium]|jgi:bifunctional UDP-N-acetylglucosamine pyrophosphorylase/glucosamine-1-phosphate N-acetyltransferase|nr:sugar phosphate nucleotidyltransferase [SAR324 cluster bacterium]|tara:strand:+ start:2095 stop:3285 length:1191 start_codon:yes stop_codon:yes gene_type:complete
MKAVILAANRSTRLSPFIETRCKPMIRIAGEYILENTICFLKEAGIHDIVLVVNHQQDLIRQYFGSGQTLGVNLEYVVQDELKGIGHALSLCRSSLEKKPFLLVYGDVMTDYNPFLSILQTYSETDREVALIALPESSKEFGNVYLDHEMKISRLVEKPQANQANYVFAGMFVLFPKIFERLAENQNDIFRSYEQLIASSGLQACLWEKGWIDMIHPWHILDANRMLMSSWQTAEIDSTVKLLGHVHLEGAVRIGPDVTIESGTVLKGPCYIGSNSYVGNNSLIRNFSAIGPDSMVGYGSELKNCVLFGNNDVGRLSFVGDSVLGENVKSGSGLTTVNHTVDYSRITCSSNSDLVETGLTKLGVFIGDSVSIGARHTLGPGSIVESGKIIADCITL